MVVHILYYVFFKTGRLFMKKKAELKLGSSRMLSLQEKKMNNDIFPGQ